MNTPVTRLTPLWRPVDTGAVGNGCSQPPRCTKEIDMYQHSSKLASAVAAAGLTVLATAGPSAAATDTGAARNDIGTTQPTDAGAARNDIGQGPAVDVGRVLNDVDTPLPASPAEPRPVSDQSVIRVDDNAIEVLQVGLGVLAGAAVTAAGVAAMRRRHAPHPA
jgi:hypothetical protein